ncbi:MAG: hypothetical protein H6Q70_498 [Firmicutes bacterium]|nr:hypothetical protein [Bacillota bacterium]
MGLDKLSNFEVLVLAKPKAYTSRPVDYEEGLENIIKEIQTRISKVYHFTPAVSKINTNTFPECIKTSKGSYDYMAVSILLSSDEKQDVPWLNNILGESDLYSVVVVKEIQTLYYTQQNS